MADTAQTITHDLERPHVNAREKMFENHLDFGAPIPRPEDVDFKTFDILDPELWRNDATWGFFDWLRDNDPLHYTPDSFSGAYWSVTRYEDIMKIDIDHKRFSSSWEYGGITLGEPFDDFELPMFIAMDEPRHSEQRKTVQPAVAPNMLKDFEPLIRSRTQGLLDNGVPDHVHGPLPGTPGPAAQE